MSAVPSVDLAFSHKYDVEHAHHYSRKHQKDWASRLTNWREQALAKKALALAGEPAMVLDLPCGTGRFWPTLAEKSNRLILAADNSEHMIQVARDSQPASILEQVRTFQTSAFEIDLDDEAVDCIFCMRLLHHISDPAHRQRLLQEFYRVSRDTVIVSLWVDGNYKSWRRKKLEARRAARGVDQNQNRFVLPRNVIEGEFRQAGFEVLAHYDLLPAYAMWRVYVLRKQA